MKNLVGKVVADISPPNQSLQRSATHKVLGRGRGRVPLVDLPRARVRKRQPAAAELRR